ncbi:MAG: class I tRNA ligase family protein, partial [Pseudomonadota bacterium]
MARHLITSAIPYINGIKHLGNLVGSQLPADLFARYMRARGHEVLFLCATDEHGTPAELAAAKAGKPVAEYCAEMWKVQDELGRGFRLSFDHFGRSSSPQNHRLTQHFAGRLDEAGLIEEVVEKQVYSNADGRFLPDRYIEGTCPEPGCDYDKARGDQCEVCTRQLEPTELINPRSAISGSTDLEIRETKHLYLKQSQMRAQLSAWIDSKKNWPILTTSIAKKWLNDGDGLQDRGITRDLDWGIPVKRGDADWPGMEGKVFYVWFDAPIEYIACAGEWVDAGKGEDWERWWRTDKGAHDVTYTQFMGKDNVPFHTLSFPATI